MAAGGSFSPGPEPTGRRSPGAACNRQLSGTIGSISQAERKLEAAAARGVATMPVGDSDAQAGDGAGYSVGFNLGSESVTGSRGHAVRLPSS